MESPEAREQKEEYVKIRKDVKFLGEGLEGLQKIVEEGVEGESDGEGFQKVVVKRQVTQEAYEEEGLVERRIRRLEVVEKIQEVVMVDGQKTSEEQIKGLEKRLLEVETIGRRLQDVEDLKARLQEVEMLEQKLQQEEEQLLDELDVWYILLDRKPTAGTLCNDHS